VLRERGPEGYAAFKSRLRLCSDDRFGPHTREITPAWPIWVYTKLPAMDGGRWYHRFGPLTATAGGFDLERDVRDGHDPLGALYPTNTTIPQKEGDTPEFLYLLPNGLGDPEEPAWGSWAGRFSLALTLLRLSCIRSASLAAWLSVRFSGRLSRHHRDLVRIGSQPSRRSSATSFRRRRSNCGGSSLKGPV